MAYRLFGKKSGAISFLPATGTITQETMTKSSKMTSNAIEGGSSIEDHVYLNPEQFQIVGVVVKNHSAFRSRLEAMWKNRDLVTYVGKFRVENYVIKMTREIVMDFRLQPRCRKPTSFLEHMWRSGRNRL